MDGLPCGSVVKSLPASAGDVGLVPESGGSPGRGTGDPLQYSGLPGKAPRQRSLAGYSPWSHKGVGHGLVTKPQQYVWKVYMIEGGFKH